MRARIQVPSEIAHVTYDDFFEQTWELQSRWVSEEEGDDTLESRLKRRFPSPYYEWRDEENMAGQATLSVFLKQVEGELPIGDQTEAPLLTITLVRENNLLYFVVEGDTIEGVVDDIVAVLEDIYSRYGDIDFRHLPFPREYYVTYDMDIPLPSNTRIEINRNTTDPINTGTFEEGENVVRLNGQSTHIYRPDGLESWWKIRTNKQNPMTGQPATKVERGKVVFKGGRRTRVRKTRRGRKATKRRRS